MKRSIFLFFLALITLTWTAQARQSAPLDPVVEANLLARIAAGDNPGFVVGIVDADGARVYGLGAVSEANSAAPNGATIYEIGSVSKVFTSLLLADMAQRGLLSVDDPAADHLPGVTFPGGKAITLAHLASHTSGLPRLPSNFAPADPADPYVDYTEAMLFDFLAGFTLPREPGAAYEYSNLGAGLLGLILGKKSGMGYEAMVAERIAGPLGLLDTGVTLAPTDASRHAPGHSLGIPVQTWQMPTLAGAGALISTADDLLRLLSAHLGLSENPLSEAMQLAVTERADAGTMGPIPLKIGLGWHVAVTGGSGLLWHNGATGGSRSFIGFDPAAGRGVVVLTNSDQPADDVGFHLLNPGAPLVPVRPVAPVGQEILAGYAGTYLLAPGFLVTIAHRANRLTAQVTGQPAFQIYPSSETRFYYKVVPAEISFQVGADGAVTGLTLHQGGRDMPAPRQ